MTTNTLPQIKTGMVVKVHHRIKDVTSKGEEKERIQIFEGTVIGTKHGKETGATFTVRKVTKGYGVEKIFPLHSPVIAKVEVVKELKVKRAKINYIRDPKFTKKLKEKKKTSK